MINVKNKEMKEKNIDIFHKGSILGLQINLPGVITARRNNFGQVSAGKRAGSESLRLYPDCEHGHHVKEK